MGIDKDFEDEYFGLPELRRSMKELCVCGCTKGSHHGGSSPWPYDYCPGNEGRMDWENGPGTTFTGTGRYKEDE